MKKLALLFLSLHLILVSCSPLTPSNTLEDVFRSEYGLSVLRNPGDNYMPGTLLRRDDDGGWTRGCSYDREIDIVANTRHSPSKSITVNLDNQTNLNGNITILNLGRIATEYRDKATITVTISNAMTHSIGDEDLSRGTIKPECVNHLKLKQELPPDKVSLVMEALEANVTAKIVFNNSANITAEAKRELLDRVSSTIGVAADHRVIGDVTISGPSLIWAIKPDHKAYGFFLRAHGLR